MSRMKEAINQIIETVANEFGVMPNALKGKSKTGTLSIPRMAAMHLAWRNIGAADRTIAYYFKRKNGQCIRYARETVPTLLETNKAFRNAYRNVEAKLEL